MKVLQVLPTLSAGGAEGFVTNLCLALSELDVEVQLFLLAGVRGARGRYLQSVLDDAGISVHGTEGRPVRSVRNVLRLRELMRRWNPDVVQANLTSAGVAVWTSALIAGRRSPLYVRRLTATEQTGGRTVTVIRLMDLFYTLNIANGRAVAEAYRALLPRHRSRVVAIQNGVSMPRGLADGNRKVAARDHFGILRDAFVISHIGRMSPSSRRVSAEPDYGPKAQNVLLQAFAIAVREVPSAVLLLAGDGPLRSQFEALAASLGIGDRTRFVGEQAEPWPVLEAGDLFCFPSRHEGCPNVLAEAAASGLPILASDIPEIREIMTGNAWVLKPKDSPHAFADGIVHIAQKRAAFAQRAEQSAVIAQQQFSMATCAQRYLTAYSDVMREKH